MLQFDDKFQAFKPQLPQKKEKTPNLTLLSFWLMIWDMVIWAYLGIQP